MTDGYPAAEITHGHGLRGATRKTIETYQKILWLLGDLLAETDNPENFGLSDAQLYDLDRVARMWPPEARRYSLPWSYYRDAGADMDVAVKLLSATERNGWSREQMRQARKNLKRGLDDTQGS